MIRLIYTSSQTPSFNRLAFEHLSECASKNNKKLGIQGLLLCNESEFMQCLEGPREAVALVYSKISKDPRHTDIRLLVCESTDEHLFDNWSMVGLATRPPSVLSSGSIAYSRLDHRLYRPWKSLGPGAADLIYEYAKVKAELDKSGETSLLSKVFDVF